MKGRLYIIMPRREAPSKDSDTGVPTSGQCVDSRASCFPGLALVVTIVAVACIQRCSQDYAWQSRCGSSSPFIRTQVRPAPRAPALPSLC